MCAGFREHGVRRNTGIIVSERKEMEKEPEGADFECVPDFGSTECGEIRVS